MGLQSSFSYLFLNSSVFISLKKVCQSIYLALEQATVISIPNSHPMRSRRVNHCHAFYVIVIDYGAGSAGERAEFYYMHTLGVENQGEYFISPMNPPA